MTTLADALIATHELLDYVMYGTATGAGTTTTLVDTGFATKEFADDYWNYGTIYFLSGTLIGKTAVVSDFAKSTGTVTFPTQTGAPGTCSYAIVSARYTRAELVSSINTALRKIGTIPQEDSTLATTDDTYEYTLPSGVTNIQRVEVALDSDADTYYTSTQWEEAKDAGKLRFYGDPPSGGYTLRLTYDGVHSAISTDAATVSSYVNLERLKYEAAVQAIMNRMQRHGSTDEAGLAEVLKEYRGQASLMAMRYPVARTPHTPHSSQW